jgi:hypothetical protein
LQHARLGYTSAVEVLHYLCDLLEYANNIDLDNFSSEFVGEKMKDIVKTMSWRADETEHETLPTLDDELFEDPDCVRYREVELERTIIDVIVQDITHTLYAISSSDSLGGEITYLFCFILLIY